MDLLLHKAQAYRHLVYNILHAQEEKAALKREYEGSVLKRLPGRFSRLGSGALTWGIIKLFILLILFDVYKKWSQMDGLNKVITWENFGKFLGDYATLLSFSALEFSIYQAIIRSVCLISLPQKQVKEKYDPVHY